MSVRTPSASDSDTRPVEAAEPIAAPEPVADAEPVAAAAPTCELTDFDRYVVQVDGPVGYIDVVGPVFVCYVGHPYAQAEEVAQVVEDFDRAVEIVTERAAASRRHKLAT